MRKRCKSQITLIFLLALLSFGMLTNAFARDSSPNVEIVAVDDSDATRHIVSDLRKNIPTAQLLTEPSKYNRKEITTIFITIGPAALRTLLAQGIDGQVISAFTSSQTYFSILENTPKHLGTITAIFAEPSPAVQFRLITALFKKSVGVASILSTKTAYMEPVLLSAALKERIDLHIEKADGTDTLNHVLNRLTSIPVILATPDSAVYSSENIRYLLITSYRRNQPVIGFSAPLVKAGALASSYSDIEDIDAQICELISDFESSGKFPPPQFPKYFSVSINDDVARSLNIVVDDSTRNMAHKPAGRQP